MSRTVASDDRHQDANGSRASTRPAGSLLAWPIDRRRFLRHLGLATAVGATSARELFASLEAATAQVQASSPAARRSEPLHVVVVGAGLAGLCAAYELEQRGHRCTVLEASSSHVGGRARTLRFDGGLYGEAGAMRIPKTHDLPRRYVDAFGLELRPFVYENPDAYLFLRGVRRRVEQEPELRRLFGLGADEREMTPSAMWTRAVLEPLRALSKEQQQELLSVAPSSRAIHELDHKSLQQLCWEAGLSDDAIEYLAVTTGLEATLNTAATEFLREEMLETWTSGFDEIVGGTDLLPAAFAQRLRSKPRMGCEVVRLEQNADRSKAVAVFRTAGRTDRVAGDLLLCTLPFSVLDRLEVEPAFSSEKQRAIRDLNYDSSTKVLAVAKRRFWEREDKIFGGGSFTDLPTGMTYYPSDNADAKNPAVSAGPGVLLASYTWGQDARRLANLERAERERFALHTLRALHPQLGDAANVLRTASWSWDQYQWSNGAFAWFLPGQYTSLHRHVVAPEGRIYFAGEHASLQHTWMQGALESALVAVREMLSSSSA